MSMSLAARRSSLLATLLLAGAPSVLAQNLPDTLGVATPPPGTVATVDEAHALVINPAGLGFMDGPQLMVAHSGVDFVSPTGASDSIYGGFRLFSRLSIGVGGDWIRAPQQFYSLPTLSPGINPVQPLMGASVLRLNVAGAFRLTDELSLGVAYRHLMGTTRRLYDLGTLDVGITLRPMRYLAAGAVLEQANSPFAGNDRLLRSVRFGLAVRPIWERITISMESRVDEGLRLDTNLLARVEFLPGVSLFLNGYWLDMLAGGGKTLSNAVNDRFQSLPGVGNQFRDATTSNLERVGVGVGFQVDLEHVGGGMLASWSPGNGFLQPSGGVPNALTGGFGTLGGVSVYGRASLNRYPSMLQMGSRAIVLTVDGKLAGKSDNNPAEAVLETVMGEEGPGELLAQLENARKDRRVQVVLLRIKALGVGWGRIVEIRRAVERLRTAGKRVVSYMESAGDEEYHIAAASDRIYLAPSGQLGLDGFNLVMQFYGAALDRIGVHVEAVAAGKYKSAPEQFMRSDPTPENMEVQRAILDGLYDVHVNAIARHRGLSQDAVKAILDRGMMGAEEALAERLVDGLAYEDELSERVAHDLKLGGKLDFNDHYGVDTLRFWRWQAPKAIAVVPLQGDIKQGRSGGGGLLGFGGGGAGSDDIIEALEAAVDDDDVKAIVLRVDSPGGDSLASDLIWNAVAKARKKKPVVASFGDLAASGGYYAACGTDFILAQPTTLTGSIGVFALHVEAKDLLDRVGINTVEESRGNMGSGGWTRPFSDAERAIIQKYVGVTYEQFLQRVKDGRKLSDAKVRELAQGRVWTGAQARDNGLVDELGGLVEAIQAAKERVGLAGDDTVEVRVFAGKTDAISRWSRALNVTTGFFTGETARKDQIRQATAMLLGDPDAVDRAMLASQSRSLAVMPYTITVR